MSPHNDASFHLYEVTCGSAALTLSLLGARAQIVPYQGSKWKFRAKLGSILALRGYTDLKAVTLNDIGPWGITWGVLSLPDQRERVAVHLEGMDKCYARTVYDSLQGSPAPSTETSGGRVRYAAEHLFLQRLSIKGKAVGTREGNWRSPGFSTSSAFGTAARVNFGPIRPMIRYLIEVVRELDVLDAVPITASCCSAENLGIGGGGRRVVYIDPDYVGTTKYPNGSFPRDPVIEQAVSWHADGALVLCSEAEPIAGLVALGWETVCLRKGTVDAKPFQSKAPEYVMVSP